MIETRPLFDPLAFIQAVQTMSDAGALPGATIELDKDSFFHLAAHLLLSMSRYNPLSPLDSPMLLFGVKITCAGPEICSLMVIPKSEKDVPVAGQCEALLNHLLAEGAAQPREQIPDDTKEMIELAQREYERLCTCGAKVAGTPHAHHCDLRRTTCRNV